MEKRPVGINLNLGCGNKFINGFVNVDTVKPDGELPPDHQFVEDDIRSLDSFENGVASNIVAFHVLEHIPVYDIEPTLIRWYEVLGPGGRVVVELPCIVKSCVNLLQMLTSKDTGLLYQNGLLGIYGTPDPKNPWMEHKWGWTFETLSQQFRNAGFVNIREEMPQTHMKTLRDFRLVADKEMK
jgi:predicted SAM-dependent methyltransferase